MGSNENVSNKKMEYEKVKFSVGYRFNPTDEELINHYLVKKVDDNSFCAIEIAEVDMNKCEPWDLPATNAGYWKSTGKDKKIFKGNALIGMKKTLVFYIGRAPSGEKSNWVMHEYRLEGNTLSEHNLSTHGMSEWVLSRVFEKHNCGKKKDGSKHGRLNSSREGSSNTNESLLPYNSENQITLSDFSHVEKPKTQDDNIVHNNESSVFNISSSSKQMDVYPLAEVITADLNQTSMVGNSSNFFFSQEQSLLRMQLENENLGTTSNQSLNQEFSFRRDSDADISSVVFGNGMFQRLSKNQELSPASGHVVNDSLWNF